MKIPKIKHYPKEMLIRDEWYKIKFVKNFTNPHKVGECDGWKYRIRIKEDQSKKETFKTLVHELVHAMDFEYNIDLKHKQVYKLEKAIHQLLKDNF